MPDPRETPSRDVRTITLTPLSIDVQHDVPGALFFRVLADSNTAAEVQRPDAVVVRDGDPIAVTGGKARVVKVAGSGVLVTFCAFRRGPRPETDEGGTATHRHDAAWCSGTHTLTVLAGDATLTLRYRIDSV